MGSTYSLSQVETLTGIKAHTLRIWERRYSFLIPLRTQTNIRYYSDDHLRKLLNISILLRNGYRIGSMDGMTDHEISERVAEILSKPSAENADEIDALTLSMLAMDEARFNGIFARQLNRRGLLATVTGLIYPFLKQVGVLWSTNKAVPAQEHFISNLVRQKIISAIEMLPLPGPHTPGILLFLPEGEFHELGLLLASYIARDLGWRVYYLGQNVPTENIEAVLELVRPDLMMTMFVTPRADKTDRLINSIAGHAGVPILVTGNPAVINLSIEREGIICASEPEDLIAILNDRRKQL